MIEKSVSGNVPDTTDIEWKLKGIAEILKCIGENPSAGASHNFENAMMFLGESLEELSDDLFSTMDEAREEGRGRHG